MGTQTMPNIYERPPAADEKTLEEMRAIRAELKALRRLLEEFAGTYLNARFPHGKPTDRWWRR